LAHPPRSGPPTRKDHRHFAVAPGSAREGISAGPDGNVWFTESADNRLGLQLFWASPEHLGLEVDGFYATYLHRQADPAGGAAWVQALEHGVSETEVAVAFLTSPEYAAAHPDGDSFIRWAKWGKMGTLY
jgi:hypothetical protein